MATVLRYAKAVVAAVGAGATYALAVFPTDHYVAVYGSAAAGLCTVIGVALTKNSLANDVAVVEQVVKYLPATTAADIERIAKILDIPLKLRLGPAVTATPTVSWTGAQQPTAPVPTPPADPPPVPDITDDAIRLIQS